MAVYLATYSVRFFISADSLTLMRAQRVSVSEKVRIAQASAFNRRNQYTRCTRVSYLLKFGRVWLNDWMYSRLSLSLARALLDILISLSGVTVKKVWGYCKCTGKSAYVHIFQVCLKARWPKIKFFFRLVKMGTYPLIRSTSCMIWLHEGSEHFYLLFSLILLVMWCTNQFLAECALLSNACNDDKRGTGVWELLDSMPLGHSQPKTIRTSQVKGYFNLVCSSRQGCWVSASWLTGKKQTNKKWAESVSLEAELGEWFMFNEIVGQFFLFQNENKRGHCIYEANLVLKWWDFLHWHSQVYLK